MEWKRTKTVSDFIKYIMAWFRRPGPMYIIKSEFNMTKMVCQVSFPGIVAADTVRRTLTIRESDQTSVVVNISPIGTPMHEFRVLKDASVVLELVDTDFAGNASAPQTKNFTAVDTVPPPVPGEMNVAIVDQEDS